MSYTPSVKKWRLEQLAESPYCHFCGLKMIDWPGDDRNATVDHIVPMGYGGGNGKSNLLLTCRHCNQAKANMLVLCECEKCQTARSGDRLHGSYDLKVVTVHTLTVDQLCELSEISRKVNDLLERRTDLMQQRGSQRWIKRSKIKPQQS